jgi:hypothetical protein
MGTTDFNIDDADAPTADYPDALGLRGEAATYDPPDAPATEVTIRGTAHDRADTWTVWIDTADGVIETTDAHVEVDR